MMHLQGGFSRILPFLATQLANMASLKPFIWADVSTFYLPNLPLEKKKSMHACGSHDDHLPDQQD